MSATLWLTGLPGAGKTTLAQQLVGQLRSLGYSACLIDGDVLRQGLSRDLGFSDADRQEQVRRAGEVAWLLAQQGTIAVVALVSPFAVDRNRVRALHGPGRFAEVWVACPVSVCVARDPKGLYALARSGQLQGLTGYDARYEPPTQPELVVHTDQCSVTEGAAVLLDWLRRSGALPAPSAP